MNKEVTIYDIATETGVSPTTVSRALNDHPAVNGKTKRKVMEMADKLGYQSNVFASNLRSKQTNNIGVIVPRLNSPFQSSVLAGMEKVANECGYNLIISQSLESYEKEKANVKTMFKSRVDGLLVSLAGSTQKTDHFSPFTEKGIPVLFFDRVSSDPDHTGVIIDNVQAAHEATEHLIAQGCRRIVHVLGSLDINVYADRLKGYKYALMDHEIPFEKGNVMVSGLSEEDGERIAESLLQASPRPDGVFVSNDTCAAGCIKALKKHGVKVPKEIAVVGFNNDLAGRLIEPQLTTVDYPGFEMGEVAMKNLINRLEDKSGSYLSSTNRITLRSSLIVRESSVRVNAKQR
ncbi:LacI family DNA-binding transcriptional regulator [Echinicola sediminis]